MSRYLIVFLTILCFSCHDEKQPETIVADAKAVKEKQEKVEFERIIFSIHPALGEEPQSKDVEITSDGKFYYRLRGIYDLSIKANYTGKLDSVVLNEVYTLYRSIDLNHLKQVRHNGFDMGFYSLRITMYNGEVQMKSMLSDDIENSVHALLKIIESQKMKQNANHKFSTAKDVLVPPPGVVYTEAELDSL